MPRLNGLELLSRLQEDEQLQGIPVAMITSRGSQKMQHLAAAKGAKGYFVKPYIEDVLLSAAQRLIAGEVLIQKDSPAD
jgi:chemosensory pili system protein ChpA (sensor histidine kinase/response regulator)